MRRRLYPLCLYPLMLLSASCELFQGGGGGTQISYSECADAESREAWGRA
ncbi:MAG: hypothetical protein ACI9SE_004457, partial [Neolewinella sp.]